jgi:hypothetical protein
MLAVLARSHEKMLYIKVRVGVLKNSVIYPSCNSVARWFISKPKIQIWVYFKGLSLENGIFYGHLGYFMNILWSFGTFCPVLVSRIKKNLATLSCNTLQQFAQRNNCYVFRW